MDHKLR